jgi:hypothetical protein
MNAVAMVTGAADVLIHDGIVLPMDGTRTVVVTVPAR